MSCLRKEERYSQFGSRHLFYSLWDSFFYEKEYSGGIIEWHK